MSRSASADDDVTGNETQAPLLGGVKKKKKTKIHGLRFLCRVQEILEIRSRHKSRLVEVDSGRQREFESKLAEVMQQLRQEHEGQLQEYKEEMHRTFSSRVHDTDEAFECFANPFKGN